MAKKVRRRRSAPTSKKSQMPKKKSEKEEDKKEDIPTMEEREEMSGHIQDVIPESYAHQSGFDRINSIPNYTEKMKENRLETLIANYFIMTPQQLTHASQDPHATILEKTTMKLFQDAVSEGKEAYDKLKYLHDRMIGKPKREVFFTGGLEQKVQYVSKEVPDLENMTREERKKFREALKLTKSLPTKEITVEGEDE
jgi:hypothetical protein